MGLSKRDRDRLSDLDRRIMAGPKVVATGAEAGRWTVNDLHARSCIAKLECTACDHKGDVPHFKLRAAGHGRTSLGRLKLVCVCGAAFPELSIVDPYRSALDPD